MRLPRHLLAVRPWRSRTGRLRHRLLDQAGWAALDRDRDPGRGPTQAELEGLVVSYDPKPSVVLAELWERRSSRGNAYFSGFLGNVSVALLRDGERPHPTREGEVVTVWKLVAQERDRPATPRPSPPEGQAAAGRRGARPRAWARLLEAVGGATGARARRRGASG
jgi:hypothetical protein